MAATFVLYQRSVPSKPQTGASSSMDTGQAAVQPGRARRIFLAIGAETSLIAGMATALLLFTFGSQWLADLSNPAMAGGLFWWIFGVMLWCSFSVVRHADHLAEELGEPYGTLILTFAVISIEVSLIASIMVFGADSPNLARDTMMAVLMIVLNGMVGTALLIGGIRHREQHFNLQGAQAFLTVIVPLATMALILPRFTTSTSDATLNPLQEAGFAALTVALYATFLAIQTSRHRNFFQEPRSGRTRDAGIEPETANPRLGATSVRSVTYHGILLLLTMLPVVLLSKKLATVVDYGIDALRAPPALGGILIATLVLTPEGISALKAALENRLQRAVNICLGSALSTIGLTVPAVLVISLTTDESVALGVDNTSIILLVLTLIVSAMTFGGIRTSMLQGAVHLVIFAAYLMLIFSP